jgi:outer membrane protein OmpA-like peptidoglycan-associated protein
MRKIKAACLIGAASLSILPGCAIWRAKLQGMLTGNGGLSSGAAPVGSAAGTGAQNSISFAALPPSKAGSTPGVLLDYSESLDEPGAETTPPIIVRQSSPPAEIAGEQSMTPAPPGSQVTIPSQPSAPSSTLPISAPVKPPPVPPAHGAPEPKPAPVPVMVSPEVAFRGVFFGRKSSDLNDAQKRALDDAVGALKEHPKLRIYVKGYTDARGSTGLNQKLSQDRAATVAAYLVSQGVPLGQLAVLGMGSTHPLAPNTTAAGRAINRRVELEPLVATPTS